ncbi:MAG: SDR family oxidoreductase [Deltaproteobacteria bacterium]|nr:SDR family oxidoreductase [Deltaproteobacteria bacterium]
MKRPFTKKIVMVTGAGAGIGRALCLDLASRGAFVVATGRSPENVEETALLIRRSGGSSMSSVLDVSDEKAVDQAITDVARRFGRLDYMVNNAGISIAGESLDLTASQFKEVFSVNFFGVLYGTLSAYRLMAAQGHGHIVNVSSLAGLLPFPVKAPYAASKHAVVGLSTTIRAEGARLGVKVSVACPGLVDTEIWQKTPIMKAEIDDILSMIPVPMLGVEKAARIILDGVAANRSIITFPFNARFLWWLYRVHPGLLDLMGWKMMKDFRKLKKDAP